MVVAAPPDVTADVVAQALRDYPHAVVVDIASVKAAILAELPEPRRRPGPLRGHPPDGRAGRNPVPSPPAASCSRPCRGCCARRKRHLPEAPCRQRVRWPIDLGAVVSEFSADEHDEAVALVSHLPQVMSSLRGQPAAGHARCMPCPWPGNGLRDVTRIAASDPTLWVQILGANAAKVVDILHGVREDLNRLIGTLENPTAPGRPAGPGPADQRRQRRPVPDSGQARRTAAGVLVADGAGR